MPLSKEQNKERMRLSRATYVQPKPLEAVQPNVNLVRTKLEAVGLKLDGNLVSLQRVQDKSLAAQPAQPKHILAPIYDWTINKPGDKVRIWQGAHLVETVVPDDGIDTSLVVSLVSRNLSKLAFSL